MYGTCQLSNAILNISKLFYWKVIHVNIWTSWRNKEITSALYPDGKQMLVRQAELQIQFQASALDAFYKHQNKQQRQEAGNTIVESIKYCI